MARWRFFTCSITYLFADNYLFEKFAGITAFDFRISKANCHSSRSAFVASFFTVSYFKPSFSKSGHADSTFDSDIDLGAS